MELLQKNQDTCIAERVPMRFLCKMQSDCTRLRFRADLNRELGLKLREGAGTVAASKRIVPTAGKRSG
jgi:hypothetical protein